MIPLVEIPELVQHYAPYFAAFRSQSCFSVPSWGVIISGKQVRTCSSSNSKYGDCDGLVNTKAAILTHHAPTWRPILTVY